MFEVRTSANATSVGRINAPKAADVLAEELRSRIRSGEWGKTEAVAAAVNDLGRYLDANLAWHMAVVRASHNELLANFMMALSNAIHRATESEAFDSPKLRQATLRIHRRVLAAIVQGDAEGARRRMARHVGAAREVALAWNGRRKQRVTTPAAPARGRHKEAAKSTRTSTRRAPAAKENQ